MTGGTLGTMLWCIGAIQVDVSGMKTRSPPVVIADRVEAGYEMSESLIDMDGVYRRRGGTVRACEIVVA